MANNCLVTKLKGVVDNNNLPKLGEWKFSAPVDGASFQINGINIDDVYLTGPGTLTKGTMGAHGWNYTVNGIVPGETLINVKNVYEMTEIVSWGGIGLTENGLPPYTKLTYIDLDWPYAGADLGVNYFNSSLLKGHNVTHLKLCDEGKHTVRVNMDDLVDSPNLDKITFSGDIRVDGSISSMYGMTLFQGWEQGRSDNPEIDVPSQLTGTFNDFGLCPALENVWYVYNYAPNVSGGSLEGLVANARKIGRTEGSMEFRYLGHRGNVTWKGQVVPLTADANLSWTATTITYNGETIQNSDVAE